MKNILLISTVNLFNNPRLVKEIHFFSEQNYHVSVICFDIGYGDKNSLILEHNFTNTRFIKLSGLRSPFLKWAQSSIFNKIALAINPFFKKSISINAIAHNKRTYLINKALKSIDTEFDLIIAHTLGALQPAYKQSLNTNSEFAFDMEDYHPGELIHHKNRDVEINRRKFLLRSILPKAKYSTYASPLFIPETNTLFKLPLKNQYTINNGFFSNEFILNNLTDSKINLIWYSLNISEGRGLELILPILKKYAEKIQLTLIGNLDEKFDKQYNISNSSFISFLGHLPQKKLHMELSKSDIGLSLEQKSKDLNRDLCLTNKIISYFQAGLYIIASPTKSQKNLIQENPNAGLISYNLEKDLLFIIENIESIRLNKEKRFLAGKSLSWDSEQKKYKEILENV